MKKLQYVLAPFMAAALLAACNNEPAGPTEAELTAQVDAKVEEVKAKLKADCDANLMNAATMMKDSIMGATATTTTTAAKPTPAPVKPTPKPTVKPTPAPVKPTPKPTPAPEPVKDKPKGLQGLSDQNKQNQPGGGGLKGLSDQEKNKAVEAGKTRGLKALSEQNK